ncbi:hypothetical protein PC119_g20021 [Phytophthora cactorum]|uniref:Tc1-like transposase DDE domain-containing protein n=1 Tax=Phytophthora cactorum TaxID=29920 RepID=A0A8T1CEL2_9STRA|nr:hypothetical protein PC112_g10039 [Phytophthora cactorum]KAG2907377.1 hypothetical protein PC117_g20236 [Phytophthora cactorum]KAG2923126.1 hypothetical protein PC115_g9072 [Phytophthora cactorum]KAG2986059.1 hypothetical protein PC119_g20021 [Phytophthora cactorum]KAG3168561.1 hypothetical protein C6341_g11292 [Phytophthora cactorum]
MDVNAAFVKRIYETVKVSATHREYFVGKKVVIVLDNAPAHNQPEERLEKAIAEHGGLELLRLGPYPPMLSPIEDYFHLVVLLNEVLTLTSNARHKSFASKMKDE